jgi:hypothetical protein
MIVRGGGVKAEGFGEVRKGDTCDS